MTWMTTSDKRMVTHYRQWSLSTLCGHSKLSGVITGRLIYIDEWIIIKN